MVQRPYRLLHCQRLGYKIMERQKAKKIFYYDGYFLPYSIYFINDKVLPDVSTGGSVACSGFSLLHKLGYETIILVGQDLHLLIIKSCRRNL